ncbi:MAG: hypothetical protein GC162_16775 [Planctomycetes bacterium]|nr:hypothetical protein [Planctomycetota bacterium]
MQIVDIALSQLRAHPSNSNVMPEGLLAKLAGHIERTGHYPPLIVRELCAEGADDSEGASTSGPPSPRPSPGGRGSEIYQVLDGHHRWKVLERLGRAAASCVVWEVDDAGALVLMSTLNRLQGADDPHRRAALICELRERTGRTAAQMAKLLPEATDQIRKYLALKEHLPRPAPARPLAELPASMHFFLSGAERAELEAALDSIGPTREAALMTLVRSHGA